MILQTDDGPLYYEVAEQTPPWVHDPQTIVFCHGIGTNCDVWASWMPVLAQHYRIVRFDTRGFGRSLSPGRKIDWTLDRYADDILEIARATGTDRFHLVGESMGGTACLRLACRPDAPLLSLACASTSHRGSRIRRANEWREMVGRDGIAAWSAQMMGWRFHPDALPPAERTWFDSVQRETCAETLLDAADLLLQVDLAADLPKIRVPVLLLASDGSPFVPPEVSTEIHRLIEGSELAVFPGSRHGLPFSHARQCAQTLLAFLRRRQI